jgi:hypothetical protein
MNPTPAILRLLRPAVTRLGSLSIRPLGAVSILRSRRSARIAISTSAVALLTLHAFAFVALDELWPQLRDPEYGRRVLNLRQRIAENPGRPLVVVIGSSRVSMGLTPAAWEESRPNEPGRPDPLLFNMALVGSGPVMELMTLRRLHADGFRPDVVVLEYWPPFLREDGPFFEPSRIDHTRLCPIDRPIVRDYFDKPDEIEKEMRLDRVNPFYRLRFRLLSQMAPRWQPWTKRLDVAWGHLDEWGWLPGLDEYPPRAELREKRLEHCEKVYRPQFSGYSIHPIADRALRETVALARSNGAKVALVYLPEASEFRSWMPPEVERAAQDYLASICHELDLPLINARDWLADGYLVDGFHLSRQGAAEFSRRFGPAVGATFPELGGGP